MDDEQVINPESLLQTNNGNYNKDLELSGGASYFMGFYMTLKILLHQSGMKG